MYFYQCGLSSKHGGKKFRLQCSVKKISHSLELLISWVQVIGVSHLQLCLIFSACSCSRLALISRSVWLHGNTAANPGLSRVAHAGVKIVMWYLLTTLSHARDFWARFSTSIQNPVSFHKTALKTANRLWHKNSIICKFNAHKLKQYILVPFSPSSPFHQ